MLECTVVDPRRRKRAGEAKLGYESRLVFTAIDEQDRDVARFMAPEAEHVLEAADAQRRRR